MVLAVVVPSGLSACSAASSAASSSCQDTLMADSSVQIAARGLSFVDLCLSSHDGIPTSNICGTIRAMSLDWLQRLSPGSCTWIVSIWSADDICLAVQALQGAFQAAGIRSRAKGAFWAQNSANRGSCFIKRRAYRSSCICLIIIGRLQSRTTVTLDMFLHSHQLCSIW